MERNQENLSVQPLGPGGSLGKDQCDAPLPEKEEVLMKSENENQLGGPSFHPPLFVQRYSFVQEVLLRQRVKHLVDFGSAECAIIRSLVGVPSLEKIQLVDLDRDLLNANRIRIRPWPYDFLQKRDNPLTVQVYCGNVTEVDQRLEGCDAITMVEFIEHLHESDLKAVIHVTFMQLRPFVVVMTTPNYEFNKLFPGPVRFRHWDHKFEWTRAEFQQWCRKICEDYGYSVEFAGIGDPPSDAKDCGCCSQAAIFTRNHGESTVQTHFFPDLYELIAQAEFPHKDKSKLDANKTFGADLAYAVNFLSHDHRLAMEEDDVKLPLMSLMNFSRIRNHCGSNINLLREQLKINGYNIQSDCVIVPIEEEKSFHPLDDVCDDNEEDCDNEKNSSVSFVSERLNATSEETWE